ncbi:hypothetical protein BS47DRAFT_1420893 [Hydnum rufescens UP504]|uniref:Uncharacterized protein n=1 Tax=Hydnum rufescens UP504 TaxID=1448309 RepID=A0A9P6B6J7_9AGAM|nr:hypothetical protein BS47DRAFT_1420893 [Hydnum rufescens UP504]
MTMIQTLQEGISSHQATDFRSPDPSDDDSIGSDPESPRRAVDQIHSMCRPNDGVHLTQSAVSKVAIILLPEFPYWSYQAPRCHQAYASDNDIHGITKPCQRLNGTARLARGIMEVGPRGKGSVSSGPAPEFVQRRSKDDVQPRPEHTHSKELLIDSQIENARRERRTHVDEAWRRREQSSIEARVQTGRLERGGSGGASQQAKLRIALGHAWKPHH